ncbi:MAG: hypothetical protein V3U76_12110 [Granulosicoccus sp.]
MSPEKHEQLATKVRQTALELILRMSEDYNLDIIVSLDDTFSLIYANAGVPAVTVPIGRDANAQPHGATFIGIDRNTDATVLAIAYAFESSSHLLPRPVIQR